MLSTPKQKRGTGGWLGAKDFRNAEARSTMAVDFFGEAKKASAIDINEMERYARALRTAGNRPGTINRKLAALSKMLSFAEHRGLISSAPTAPLEEEPEGRIRFLTAAEEHQADAMLEIMGEHDFRHMVQFLVDTGARFSEAQAMGMGSYSLGDQPTATFWETKGGRPRTVPLTKRATAAIRFFAGRGEAGPFAGMDYWSVRATWDRARVRLGDAFNDVTIHTFRHTCCSRLVQGGMDLRRVQIWMGHADIKTTLRYAHLAPGDLNLMTDVLEKAVAGGNVVPMKRTA